MSLRGREKGCVTWNKGLTLCERCHNRTHLNRQTWTRFFMELVEKNKDNDFALGYYKNKSSVTTQQEIVREIGETK